MTKIYLAPDRPRHDERRGRRNAERHRAAKPLTSYAVALAFRRIDFYLNVLDAHFAALGAMLKQENTATKAKQENPAREERTKRSAP